MDENPYMSFYEKSLQHPENLVAIHNSYSSDAFLSLDWYVRVAFLAIIQEYR